MVALKEYASHVKAAVHAGADLIISGAGLPTELPALVSGSKTKIAPIVSTDKSAKVILKYWERKYKRTADLVVIEGPQAGGHLGFHKEELDSYTPEAYDNEIRKIVQTVKSYAAKIRHGNPCSSCRRHRHARGCKVRPDLGVTAFRSPPVLSQRKNVTQTSG